MERRFSVTWGGGSARVEAGTLLSRALLSRGLIETPCGGRGRCLKCLVKVLSGDAPPTADDLDRLSKAQIDEGYRLSCSLPVTSDMRVAALAGNVECRPHGPEPVSNDANRGRLGFALDLGTTTLAGSLLDMESGERIASGACPNPQARHGADLISRLSFALKSRENAQEIRGLPLDAARGLLASLCGAASAPPLSVQSGVLVGNTAMHHLALALDVSGLAHAPFNPASRGPATLCWPGLPPLYAAPVIAGFVGSDAVACLVSSGLLRRDRFPRLLIDLGTNTEVLLRRGDRLLVASAPAGPAFEGGEISQGMRALPGAVESVRFDSRDRSLGYSTIDNAPPRGICGSGLIDAVAALLEAGWMDSGGRLLRSAEREVNGQPILPAVQIAPGVSLTQKDVRAFQLAKGAVRAAVDSVLEEAAVSSEELGEILLAGAFGAHVDTDSAIATGLLPPVHPGIVRPVGNAALAGAEMMLLSRDAVCEAERAAASASHVEIAVRPGFQEMFMEALQFTVGRG